MKVFFLPLKKTKNKYLVCVKNPQLIFVKDFKNWSNRGQIPIKAHCSLPDGVTKIGDELEIEISHCGSQDYFTHEINYESVTINQIIALIQSSTECYQKIEYHCLSTPLAVSVSNLQFIYVYFFVNFLTNFSKLTVTINFSNLAISILIVNA